MCIQVFNKKGGRGNANTLTIARSLFNDIKRSGCLVRLRPSISLGRRRGCCRALARMVTCPLWDSRAWHPKKWEHPTPQAEGPKCAALGVPQLPHDCPPIWPFHPWGPWSFSAAWRPFKVPPHLPRGPRLTFSSSSLERHSIRG